MSKIFLVDAHDRHCPENNNGEWIQAAFSTEELAQQYIDIHDPIDEKGKRTGWKALSIREMELDLPLEKEDSISDEDFDWDQFDKDLEFLKNNRDKI